ncbi:EXS-domain-containing protein [Aulographum hederae CBS 113979]|uniref:EXS-domain-containing protein n=1 Tax=Aulographum hederae CBS 113979 TaxID=1176131 RepID=A0A6G1HDM8_9PEZI|nr:EXS-domain-containing protein [Aulographum hederae CBS 113979]
MKFAKELEENLVPEWRVKYLDYKTGKKKLKAVDRALRNLQSPGTPRKLRGPFGNSPLAFYTPRSGRLNRTTTREEGNAADDDAIEVVGGNGVGEGEARPINIERSPLRAPNSGPGGEMTRYGSIIGSPPNHPPSQRLPTLELPDPAMRGDRRDNTPGRTPDRINEEEEDPMKARPPSAPSAPSAPAAAPDSGDAFNVGRPRTPRNGSTMQSRKRDYFLPRRRTFSVPVADGGHERPLMKRLMSIGGRNTAASSPRSVDVPLEAFRDVDLRQSEFFRFLDSELDKIETFYKEKENEATERLKVLRDQLHIMRDRRMEELVRAKNSRSNARAEGLGTANGQSTSNSEVDKGPTRPSRYNGAGIWSNTVGKAVEKAKTGRIGKGTKAMQGLGTPTTNAIDSLRDYTRRAAGSEIPYRIAKRKLKTALAEYYRGLELLKSYALLNRTGFRKINKKYDKRVRAKPAGRYMTEKVNTASFVQSDVIDEHIRAVEDLYARYFERGHHKVAAQKLRAKSSRATAYNASSFRNGLLLAAGTVLGLQGLVYGAQLLYVDDPVLAVQTSYLMQIYAGYFLLLLLVLFFCLACRFWTRSKINYVFIFEFDTRHHLDWRQLAEWRLLLAGLYPVEFRDFFLGDMYCSQTYSLGNIELFFCLYARYWNDPPMCNSSHSRLLGFFSALPGVWRALQCLRRYYDTGNKFPHLVNCGKYTFTILYYMSLSLYRIDKTWQLRGLFIGFASVNAIYCSLMDPYARKYPFLRDTLGYKQIWLYYLAIVVDPILRFNWIFYAIFGNDVQHSALLSFFVAFSEVCRRGLWILFRVENEHCTNVGRFRASRDIPLPYETFVTPTESTPSLSPSQRQQPSRSHEPTPHGTPGDLHPTPSHTSGADLEQGAPHAQEGLRRRGRTGPGTPSLFRVGSILHNAHAQDFERKRPAAGMEVDQEEQSSDEDDEDGDGDGDRRGAEEIDDEEIETQLRIGEALVREEEGGVGDGGKGGKSGKGGGGGGDGR